MRSRVQLAVTFALLTLGAHFAQDVRATAHVARLIAAILVGACGTAAAAWVSVDRNR